VGKPARPTAYLAGFLYSKFILLYIDFIKFLIKVYLMANPEDPVARKLTAILLLDVVAYSRLMGVDEVRTLTQLNAHRKELIDPTIAGHHGRIVKLMGDGALVEFSSIVDAVACAHEIQTGMVKRNSTVPDAEKIEFRIGINLGDVIVEDDDIYGDGVNHCRAS
jgi:adenylate cyclase